MLTSFDDYPLHQTSQPIAHAASGDLNHYDRYFFNGYAKDASLYFGVAMGLYPNRQVVDAAFSVVHGAPENREQVSVHASGRAPIDRLQATMVGPIRVEVVVPLQVLRVLVDAPEQGLRADLTFRARTKAVEEPHFMLRQGVRVVFDYTRMTQWGSWEGWVEIDGSRTEVSPADVVGSRDRSWGLRGVGERPGGASTGLIQFYWLWAPLNFDDMCLHFDVNEHADGRRWHETGFVVPVGDGEPEAVERVDYAITWAPGTRSASSFRLDLHRWRAPSLGVTLEPIVNFQMLGIGYLHPTWGHGVWKGELEVGGERWSLPVSDPLAAQHVHIQALCRAVRDDEAEGLGILEQLVLGPHEPSGFTSFLDSATG